MVRRSACTALAMAASLLAAWSSEARLSPCHGRYLVRGEPLLADILGVSALEVWTVGDGGVGLGIGCAPVEAKRLRASRRGTRIRVRWDTCAGLEGRVRLRARIDPACETMTGRLGAKKSRFRRMFTATRSRCGDGLVDVEGGEPCDGDVASCTTTCGSTGAGSCMPTCELAPAEMCTPPVETCTFADDDCDGLIDEEVRLPLALRTVRTERSHGLRIVPAGTGFIAAYHLIGNVWLQRLGPDGALLGDPVEAASGVVDFDVVESDGTLAVVWVNAGRIFGTLLAAGDLSVVTPQTLLSNPGPATDRVRINYEAARGSLLVVYEIGGVLAAVAVTTPALGDAPLFANIISIDVTRRFGATARGTPAYVFFTTEGDGLLRGARLNDDGTDAGPTVAITTGAGIDRDPAVARVGEGGATSIGVAWAHDGDARLRFAVLDGSLVPVRGPIDLRAVPTTPEFVVLDPAGGVNRPIDLAAFAGRFLVTAVHPDGGNLWYAHEVVPADGEPSGLRARLLLPHPCGDQPCDGAVYTNAAVAANGLHALFGSTRTDSENGDSARVAPFGCP